MGASRNRSEFGIFSGPPGEDIPDGIFAQSQTELCAKRFYERASFEVGFGKQDAGDDWSERFRDAGEIINLLLQAPGINREGSHHGYVLLSGFTGFLAG